MRTIKMGRDFSPCPGGRVREDGPRCAEAFREDTLRPALDAEDVVVLHLDCAEGYGSSFLDEAFGGLVRSGRYTAGELHRKLRLDSRDEVLVREIWSYIDHAREPASAGPAPV